MVSKPNIFTAPAMKSDKRIAYQREYRRTHKERYGECPHQVKNEHA